MDPFCGSGTFPIEAAMMAANMAPGRNRSFTAEEWPHIVGKKIWYDKEKLQTDINLLSSMSCKVNVVGYVINCLEDSKKVVKPMAIYIE